LKLNEFATIGNIDKSRIEIVNAGYIVFCMCLCPYEAIGRLLLNRLLYFIISKVESYIRGALAIKNYFLIIQCLFY
jgi:hypothetical protein